MGQVSHVTDELGISDLGSFCVEIEAAGGTKGFDTVFRGPSACWLVVQHFERVLLSAVSHDDPTLRSKYMLMSLRPTRY